jgi:hypothetical protein
MSDLPTPPDLLPDPEPNLPPDDAWAWEFFSRLLAGTLTTEAFESAVQHHWQRGEVILHAPATARAVREIATRPHHRPAGYASDAPDLGFASQWLAGRSGGPGAIHIQAPPEAVGSGDLKQLNRPPHEHDSGRIALVTEGAAIFHVLRADAAGSPQRLDIPVGPGDLIFWPAWTPHTFDACRGFWVVSAMAAYVSPAADGFVFPAAADLDSLPRRADRQDASDQA